MKRNPWSLFATILALLIIGILWQAVRSPEVLGLIAVGVLFLVLANRMRRNSVGKKMLGTIGGLFIFFSLSTSWFFWFTLAIIILFLGLESYRFMPNLRNFEKSLHIINTVQPLENGGKRYKRSWLSNDRIGTKEVYEWDDINITKLSGDTFIDLGNTLLPKEDSIILIRKGFGQTKVFVPTGISIMIEHSTLVGNVRFNGEKYTLKNESIRLYSDDYDFANRRLKIITSTIVGDLEVIQL